MSKLSNHLVEQILLEESKIKKVVVVYVGRFQPMHQGHYKTFAHLQKKFGKGNVYVGTSNKTEKGRSPFNFREKKKIMTTMFSIPSNRVVQVKNPYVPTEVLKRFNKKTTAFVTVVGQKDASRLDGKFFRKWDGNPTEGYEDVGYLYIAPMQGGAISGTEVRQGLSMGSDDQKEKFFKDRAYGKFNKSIFKLVTDKLNESLFVPKETIEEYMMEISTGGLGGLDVDDGPNFFIPNYKTFRKVAADRATKLGYTIVNMIGDEKFEDYYEHPQYPDGPQTTVSYFPAGVIGTMTPNNQVDIYSSGAYSNWYKHVTRNAALVGYDVIKKLDIEKDDKEQSTDDAKGAKDLEKEFESSLKESITLPVKVGDTILMGRFKNKKVVIKSIGKDEHGMPTINGRKVVTFRLMKEGFDVDLEDVEFPSDMPQDENTLEESCDRPMKGETEQQFRTRCFGVNPLAQPPKGLMRVGEDVDIDERSKGRLRPAALLRRKAAMAGKRAAIQRARKRTMTRRKPLSKLKKIAYKKAYLQVYDEFMKDLYPGKKKSELSIQQAKVVHKNVLRKKGRVRKRAKFRFLPDLRAKEVEKFGKTEAKNETLGYPSKEDMNRINQRLDKQRNNTDSNKEYQYDTIKEVNEFFYMDFKKYVWKRRGEINRKLKGLSPKEKKTFLELLWKKQFGKNKSWSKVDGSELHQMLKKDKYVKEGLKEKGITDFKSLFKKMPSDLQKRVYNLKNFGQRLDKHPEGNVLKHTIMVVNRSIKDDDIDIAIAAMFHDIGKDETAGIHPKKGHITHFGHERVSASLVKKYKKFIESVGGNTANVFYIVKNHMKYKQLSDMRPKKADKVKSFRAFDKLGKFSKHDKGGLGEEVITEGGAYGHMSHPFDTDINLTFGQLKDIVNRALEGTLEFTREKTDGQALAVSWRDGRLVAARNKGHLKNKGENALDIKGVSDKFQGRGGLSDAYNFAMRDLSKAISSLSEKQRTKVFKDGACFMNLEVIYPTSVNVIAYGQALLVFHGTMEYNDEGVAIGENTEAARVLAGMIKQVNKDVQDNYTIQGPPIVKLPKSQDLSKKRAKYSSQISKLQKQFGLKDTDGVANYHQSWWEQFVDKKSPSTLDNKTKMGLVKRWAFMDKKFRLDSKNISDSKTLEWAKKTDKDNHKKISKDNLMKFEKIFLGLGAEVLEFTSSALTVNPDKAVRDIKKRIDKTIKDVKKSGDPKKIEKLKLELKRLNSIGGAKKIVPNEGIVFQYKGNTFKLTGTFASVNQILGIFF